MRTYRLGCKKHTNNRINFLKQKHNKKVVGMILIHFSYKVKTRLSRFQTLRVRINYMSQSMLPWRVHV